jgi:hypothetical protein
MSLPSVPLAPTTNDPQGIGHPNTVTQILTATNTTPGAPAGVSIVQTDRVTASSAATLELSGGLGGDGAVGGSNYTFYKGCGPQGSGVIYPDHLQLFRFGPTGAVQPTLSQVLDIGPKLGAADPLLPAVNLMTLYADLQVAGALSSTRGSFGATNPPLDTVPAVGYNTMVLAGFRFIWGRVLTNPLSDPNPGLFAAVFPSSLVSLNTDGSIKGCVSLATVVASDTAAAYTCHFIDSGRVVGPNSVIDGNCEAGGGPGGGVSIVYLVIATAA